MKTNLYRKTKISALFLLLLAVLFTFPASAHSGRTDASGGHYNTATGEYHYHHGYPAHQHINGVCPYAFDDKTSHSSGSSSSEPNSKTYSDSSGTTEQTIEKEAVEKNEEEEKEQSEGTEESLFHKIIDRIIIILFAIVFGGLPAFFTVAPIVVIICFPIYMLLDRLHAFDGIRKRKYEKERGIQTDFFDGKSCREKAGVPSNVEIGDDYWPKSISGMDCTVYYTKTGTSYHKKNCRCLKSSYSCNLFQIPNGYRPCSVCMPIAYNGSRKWVDDYRKYIKIKEKYDIPDPDIPQKE